MKRVGVFIVGRNGHSTFYADPPDKRHDGPALAKHLDSKVTGGPFKSLVAYARPTKSSK